MAWILAIAVAAAGPVCGGPYFGVASASAAAKADPGKALSDEAAAKFKEGKFLEAAELFERAFALSPDRLVRLRNAGRAYEEAGRLDYARLLFARYLQQAPEGPEKKEVADRVAALDQKLAEQKRAEAERQAAAQASEAAKSAPVATAVQAEPKESNTYPWVLLGSGVALLAAGGGWLGYTQGKSADVESAYIAGQYDYKGGTTKLLDDRSTVHSNQAMAWTTIGIGAAAALGGGLWLFWPSSPARVAVLPYPTGPGATLSLRF